MSMYETSFRITELRNRLHMEREEHAKAIQREVDCRKELNKSLQQEYNDLSKKMEKQENKYQTDLLLQEEQFQAQLSEERAETIKFKKQYQEIMEEQKELLSRLSKEQLHSKHLQDERDDYHNKLQNFLKSFNAYVETTDTQLEQTKSLLSTKDDELKKLRGELKDKTERLASTFQRRLKHDQRRVENAVEFNTPSDVENDFKDFLDGQRLDACDVIQSTLSPTEEMDMQIRYLAGIVFVTAYEQMEEARQAAYDLFNDIIRQLIDEAPKKSQELCIRRKEDGFCAQFHVTFEVSAERNEIKDTKDIVDGLMLSLKQTAHSCELQCFEEDVKRIVRERWRKCLHGRKEMPLLPPFCEEVIQNLDDYIKACNRMAWKLVTQLPPLQLEYISTKFNERMHRLTRLHNNNESTEHRHSESIVCYLWPALVERGGRVIFPGEVLCK